MTKDKRHNTRSFLLLSAATILIASGVWFGLSNPNEASTRDRGLRTTEKIRAVHYFGRSMEHQEDFQIISSNHVEYLVLVPYGYQSTYDNPDLSFNRRRRRANVSRDSMYVEIARQADAQGLNLIIKPHIWMRTNSDKWRSDIDFKTETEWNTWKSNYKNFIIHYARLSEQVGATHFCIGTELASVTRSHPEFWIDLIGEVRKVYSGKVFYAANWYREFEKITFWDHLDYIGIQAYFPLCRKENPSLEDIRRGWKPHVANIRKQSRKYNRPVLFTEVGYKSTEDAAVDPWEWIDHENTEKWKPSHDTQALCYQAMFESFWHQSWFAGALIWQWRGNHQEVGGLADLDFTPQNKPAQRIISDWFAKK